VERVDNQVLTYSPDGKVQATIQADPADDAYVSPDGKLIAVASSGGIALYDDKGVYPGSITFVDPSITYKPSLSWFPDSSTLAVSYLAWAWLVKVPH